MEQLNSKLYDKYNNLKKRKLFEEGDQKRESAIKEYHEATEDLVEELKNENERLFAKLSSLHQQFAQTEKLFLEETQKTKELCSEILRLQNLLAQKNDINNLTAMGSPDTTPKVISEKPTLVSPTKKTPKSSSKGNVVQSSEAAVVSHGHFGEEPSRSDCCRRYMASSGDGTEKSCSTCVFHTLMELLVGMKFSINNETEGFSISIFHEASGYTFSLTWIREQPGGGELLYRLSSLGTLERIAVDWMKEDIVFSMTMCPIFFQRISRVVGRG